MQPRLAQKALTPATAIGVAKDLYDDLLVARQVPARERLGIVPAANTTRGSYSHLPASTGWRRVSGTPSAFKADDRFFPAGCQLDSELEGVLD